MSNWKKYPNLFANGKFKCKENNLLITGITWMNKEPKFWFENDRYFWAKDCQLIARPIEDMTDEECDELRKRFPNTFNIQPDYSLIKILKTASLTSWSTCIEVFLYLLSIGVYPFSDTEDVIFKPKQQ